MTVTVVTRLCIVLTARALESRSDMDACPTFLCRPTCQIDPTRYRQQQHIQKSNLNRLRVR